MLTTPEATLIAQKAGGAKNTPGIWSDEQISRRKEVVCVTHSETECIIVCPRCNGSVQANVLEKENIEYVSVSDIPLPGGPKPCSLTVDEIHEYTEMYAQGTVNAIEKAGFNSIKIHSANRYLIDRLLHLGSNFRTNEYGGSIENGVRFAPEVTEAIERAMGQKKTGF
ncbi:hypothetical protein K438DRAFT_1621157 [Mycena galopus ATCC 62051]|nr:hypothetical protein K438DRAFT_1621157 [Mycena galopus ATCC 62051]